MYIIDMLKRIILHGIIRIGLIIWTETLCTHRILSSTKLINNAKCLLFFVTKFVSVVFIISKFVITFVACNSHE